MFLSNTISKKTINYDPLRMIVCSSKFKAQLSSTEKGKKRKTIDVAGSLPDTLRLPTDHRSAIKAQEC
uniref:AlNc14C166G7886 protein n=1 Tax=Albugo laibachii Nc14 TaxID=890382 RepID=F0WN53_9STRA|nr:AlNc14C166G7886 [Albugo laibachii Nc14]|eukprot:CCA22742.1 AlNc14C166G7886 [Albugo laibachii Nc14]